MQYNDAQLLKLNFNSDNAQLSLRQTLTHLPNEVEVYLIGGSIRNALYRMFHGTILTQRDYDQVVTKGSRIYTDYLKSQAFEERPYPSRQDEQVAYDLPLNEQAKDGDSYINWLVFDMHTVDGTSIEENIKNNVAFSINGCAVNARDLYTKPWQEALVQAIPTAMSDIKEKKLRLNLRGYQQYPSNFFAMLRFMSVGFSAPPQHEVELLLKELPRLEHARFERNVTKVWNYVGGEDKARELVKSLGIEIDVFNEEALKSARF